MAITNLMGPSMRKKEANKGIIDWSIVTVGAGLQFTHERGMPDTTSQADAELVPWGDALEDVVVLNTKGYTGDIELTASGTVTISVVNGVITDVV